MRSPPNSPFTLPCQPHGTELKVLMVYMNYDRMKLACQDTLPSSFFPDAEVPSISRVEACCVVDVYNYTYYVIFIQPLVFPAYPWL